jgi:hypothetical protein
MEENKMTRINLIKYGFIRFPEEDFSDDGNRFTCYRFSDTNSHISKLVADGQAYLSAHVYGQLPYDVYSKLPYYKEATWDFNGISVASLTDEMLQDFFRACVQYEKEYQAAEAAIEYPTECELLAKCIRIQNKLLREMNEIETLMGENAVEAATKFSKWEWQKLQEYLTHMLEDLSKYKPDTFIPNVLGTAQSITFLQNKESTEPTYWYKSIKEIFDKYGISSI